MQRFIMAATLLIALGLGLVVDQVVSAQDGSSEGTGIGAYIGSGGSSSDQGSSTEGSGLGSFVGSGESSGDQVSSVDQGSSSDANTGLGASVGGEGAATANTATGNVTSMPSTGSGFSASSSIALSTVLLALLAVVSLAFGAGSVVRTRRV